MALADPSDFSTEEDRRGGFARFFGVMFDRKTYGAMVYMLLALATGIFYFTWVVTGISLSLGMMILIVGIPLALLFIATVRGLSYFEGYLAQGLLGANLRVEEVAEEVGEGEEITLWTRIKSMLADVRTWTSMVYMVLQLGLGIMYFTFVVTALVVSISFIGAPIAEIFYPGEVMTVDAEGLAYLESHMPILADVVSSPYVSLALVPLGLLILFLSLHVMRGVGFVHRKLAEALLVRRA